MSSGPRIPPTIGPTRGPLLSRVAAALFLRRDFYERAAADPAATGPAGAIVCLAALVRESVVIYEISQVWRGWGLIVPILMAVALLAWLLLGVVAWVVTRPLQAAPSLRGLLRCLGFAQTPTMLLATLASLSDPTAYLVAYVAIMLWIFAAGVVALRAASQRTTARAALLALPVFLTQFVLLLLTRYVVLG